MKTIRCFRPAFRPYLHPRARAAYLRFYSIAQAGLVPRLRTGNSDELKRWKDKEKYPRIKKEDAALDYPTFKQRYTLLGPGDMKPDEEVVVRGMSTYNMDLVMTHAVKEGYRHFGLQGQSLDSSTCFKTVGICS